jgi:hypothetical protein
MLGSDGRKRRGGALADRRRALVGGDRGADAWPLVVGRAERAEACRSVSAKRTRSYHVLVDCRSRGIAPGRSRGGSVDRLAFYQNLMMGMGNDINLFSASSATANYTCQTSCSECAGWIYGLL